MNAAEFHRLADLYGFAPSRALRELLDAATAGQPERKPLTSKEAAAWMDRAPNGIYTMDPETIWLVAFQFAEMAHGIRRKK